VSTGIGSDAAERWLVATLANDATLTGLGITGVYVDVAPESASFPCIVIGQQTARDVMVVGAYRIFENLLFLVRAVGQTQSYAALASAASRIDALLHRQSGSGADGTTWGCVREQSFRLAEVQSGVQYRHSGGVFRLFTTS